MKREIRKLIADIRRVGECGVHWRGMREDRQGGDTPTEDNCALCRAYPDSCSRCPICQQTGQGACDGTPYQRASRDFWNGTDAEWQASSTKMIDYLAALKRKLQARLRRRTA